MITVSIQSKNLEPKNTITKININEANWDIFTSNEAWKQITNPNRSQFAEALTEDSYKKKFKISSESAIPVIEKKHFPKPWWGGQLQKKTKRQKRTIQQNLKKIQLRATPVPVENR